MTEDEVTEAIEKVTHITRIVVICPKHGEHEHAITSNIPGHEGVWCQICWIESMGQSLPYRKTKEPIKAYQSSY